VRLAREPRGERERRRQDPHRARRRGAHDSPKKVHHVLPEGSRNQVAELATTTFTVISAV
jgi:hypothetical protein